MALSNEDNGYLDLRKVCYPCLYFDHEACRHHPDNDGSSWVVDDGGERRLALFEGGVHGRVGRGREIPRPPCQCEADNHRGNPGTCNAVKTNDWGYARRCGKPAKGTIDLPLRFTRGFAEVEVCGIHRAARQRVKNNDRARQEEWDYQKKQGKLKSSAHKASEDWAQKLRVEFGLPTTPNQYGGTEVRVLMSPEVAYKTLVEVKALLDDVYDDHPFRA